MSAIRPRRARREVSKLIEQIRTLLTAINGKPPTRRHVARVVDASEATVFNWERGRTTPSRRTLVQLERAVAETRLAADALKPTLEKARSRAPRLDVEDCSIRYANVVRLERGTADEVHVMFAVRLPGEPEARLVASLLVPSRVARQISPI